MVGSLSYGSGVFILNAESGNRAGMQEKEASQSVEMEGH